MLARLAANAPNSQSADEEAAIEKYLRSVMSLENILTLDRLRQVDGENGKTKVCVKWYRLNNMDVNCVFVF